MSTVVLLAVYSPSIGRLMSSEQREEQLFAKFQFLMESSERYWQKTIGGNGWPHIGKLSGITDRKLHIEYQ